LALYDALVATHPSVVRKGDTMPYTSLNGNMFSLLTKAGKVALRLPSDARDAFLRKHPDALCVQYGIVMKEYVELPDALLARRARRRSCSTSAWRVRELAPAETDDRQESAGEEGLSAARAVALSATRSDTPARGRSTLGETDGARRRWR